VFELRFVVRNATVFLSLLLLSLAQAPAANETVTARMRRDITFLASDRCEGRGVTTKGINLAADYIADQFREAGLKPARGDGSYFQPFTMSGGAELYAPNTLSLRGPLGQTIELRSGTDFQPLGLSASGKLTAPLVFVGYGATAKDAGYDDFKNLDLTGKVVVILRKTPRPENPYVPFDGNNSAYHAALTTKLTNAQLHGAAAVIVVNDRQTAKDADVLMPFSYVSFGPPAKLPAIHARRSVVDGLLESSWGKGLGEIEQEIDRDLRPRSARLTGWTASLEVNVRRRMVPVKNIVGVVEGSGTLAKETVIIGAHYDHLGYGGPGSLATAKLQGKAIHHGADDNASGTTMLMELARRFASRPNHEGRSLVFIAFSGEESGLLGSEYYCKDPLFPLAETVAMVNMDMVGRLRQDKETKKNKLIVYGTGTATTFDKLIDALNTKLGFQLQKVTTGMGPSDQQSFYVKNIPVFFFFTGDHPDYHRPSDTADKINMEGMEQVSDLVESLIDNLRTTRERPTFVKVKGGMSASPGMRGPRLGIRPTYGDDKDGVLLSGVTEGTPAAKAGLREGDRILEMAGKPVKNLETYMAVMAGQKKGDSLELGILREGKRVNVKVLLE
jgi:hypothetical protein